MPLETLHPFYCVRCNRVNRGDVAPIVQRFRRLNQFGPASFALLLIDKELLSTRFLGVNAVKPRLGQWRCPALRFDQGR
jgi:hypothetical protein